eukprot:3130535-Amphidinium_carterae.1
MGLHRSCNPPVRALTPSFLAQELLSLEMDRIDQARIAEQRDIHRFGMLERTRQNRLAKDSVATK